MVGAEEAREAELRRLHGDVVEVQERDRERLRLDADDRLARLEAASANLERRP